jgi:hypothetical protein
LCIFVETIEVASFFVTGLETLQILGVEIKKLLPNICPCHFTVTGAKEKK